MKIYSLLLVFVMVFALVVFSACGKDKNDGGNAGETKGDQAIASGVASESGTKVTEGATEEETEEDTAYINETYFDPAETVDPEQVEIPEGETGAPTAESEEVYGPGGGDSVTDPYVSQKPEEIVEVEPKPEVPETKEETKPVETNKNVSTGYRPNPNGIELPEVEL